MYRQLGLVKAAMSLIEEDQLDTLLQRDGHRPSRCRAARSPTPSPASRRSAERAATSARSPTTSSVERFTHDLRSMGVELDLAIAAADEGATGRCHVFITDDAQRTMATYLGASNQLRVA